MTGFRFQDPLWLVLLVPLAALAWRLGRRRADAVTYSSVELLKTLPTTAAQRVRRALPWLGRLGLAMFVVALARPQLGREEHRVQAEGIAIEMCIDRSGSMQTKDFELDGQPASRLDVVKKTFRQFVDGGGGLRGRPDDMIGLIDFGGYVEVKCPLTLDHGALNQMLDTVKIAEPIVDAAGQIDRKLLQEDQSTAIGDALATSVDRLLCSTSPTNLSAANRVEQGSLATSASKPIKAKSKIIILLSDGVSNSGILQPDEAAQIAKTFGIKIYTIGIGTTGVAAVEATDAFGRTVMVPREAEFDEAAMRRIAETTGGQYFSAGNTESLKNVYAEIDKLEKTVSEGRIYTSYGELFEYVLLPGLALLLLQVGLVSTRFRTLP